MSTIPRLAELAAKAELASVEFLQTDLRVCFTFIELAGTEASLGDTSGARTTLRKARDRLATISRFQAALRDAEKREEIGGELARLRSAIATAEDQLGTTEQASLPG